VANQAGAFEQESGGTRRNQEWDMYIHGGSPPDLVWVAYKPQALHPVRWIQLGGALSEISKSRKGPINGAREGLL
jgi:hypothetical protein